MPQAEVVIVIESDKDDGTVMLRVPETKRSQRFHVGAQSDEDVGSFVLDYVIALGLKKMQSEKRVKRVKPIPSRLHSDGTREGHLQRIAHAIKQKDKAVLKTYPIEEIEAAKAYL